YPPVAGMQKDVFFLSHMNAEDGAADDSVSKTNQFEVAMVVDLVKYFLKQEAYSAPGDVAVLCAYLGQLQQVRAALRDLQIDVSLDDRDTEQLERHGISDEDALEKVSVVKHIRLGTVDVFQGEEAKIVIVSLVRNTGTFESENASIGFLKSSNRINVALSRAQHGLYVLGNASNLRKNATWKTIIDEMDAKEQIGFGIPICCPRHPDRTSIITVPGELSQKAPEVCGEPCSDQTCVECLPKHKKKDIVDFLMQRTLEDIDLTSEETSDRLITLTCGHIFTVETLDGHCHMPDYYEVDPYTGSYLSTKAPPVDFQNPPTCPTCRSPITALRYGRVVKRANLDILERNVASNMAKELEQLWPAVQVLVAELPELQDKARKLEYREASSRIDEINEDRRTSLSKANPKEIAHHNLFTSNGLHYFHGLSTAEGRQWFKIISDVHKLYKKVASISRRRSSHVRAYEAALSTLFRLEMAHLGSGDEVGAVNAPEQLALDIVHKNIGQPPPKADVRYQIEAFLLSVELRFMLGQIATSRMEGLTVTSNEEKEVDHRRLWSSFVEFLYRSCEVDCQKALAIAESSSSSRLAARSATSSLCARFERFRFSLLQKREEHVRAGTAQKQEVRQGMVKEIHERIQEWTQYMKQAEDTYMRSRQQESLAERAWFRENCRSKIERILQEAHALETHIKRDTFYQSVSLQEKESIVKAFGFSHRGHFYNCPNGHTFVITEVREVPPSTMNFRTENTGSAEEPWRRVGARNVERSLEEAIITLTHPIPVHASLKRSRDGKVQKTVRGGGLQTP
ncbi:hypothetical protein V5O48_018631, partial [Marasmius crinis-equi]